VNTFIVDASVAAKWILPGSAEPLQREAVHLLEQWADNQVKLVVPDFFWVEITNILWRAVRAGRCTTEIADSALAALRLNAIPTLPALPLLESAIGTAIVHGRTVYDSIYVALAVEMDAHFVTADEKLVNALAARLPVMWLGAI
jgi:predicted nucleic acid-binding protein